MAYPSHMYDDTVTWNPFKGCRFACTYCVPSFQRQAKRQKRNCAACYSYDPHEHPERLGKVPTAPTVFACGNGDVAFCEPEFLAEIVEAIAHRGRPGQTFYLQSKQPECLEAVLPRLPPSVVLVTTLETNRDAGYADVSQAPVPTERYRQFAALDYPRKVVTIEPIMAFDPGFAAWIADLAPEYVWLGFNSRPAEIALPEPTDEELVNLHQALIARGLEVKPKNARAVALVVEAYRRHAVEAACFEALVAPIVGDQQDPPA